MANTPNYDLLLPNPTGTEDVHQSLTDNFNKIDTGIKASDDKAQSVKAEVEAARTTPDGVTQVDLQAAIKWVYDNAVGSGSGSGGSGDDTTTSLVIASSGGTKYEITLEDDGDIVTTPTDKSITVLSATVASQVQTAIDAYESMQSQLDSISSGNSSVAVDQAKVDEDNVEHSSLKDRIDSGFIEVKGQIDIITKNRINIISKGADPTGVLNSTQAFKDAIAEAESKITSDPNVFSGTNEGNIVIELPPGTYLISDDDPRLLSLTTTVARGLVFKGSGRGVTKVLFKPTASNGYLFYNNNKWMHLSFEGISFIGDFTKSTNFMYSYSTAYTQNYTFDKCDFFSFNYGWKLEGSNTNSEMTWFHCGFYYSWNKVVYAESALANDQFLNYNFYSCQAEMAQGDFLHYEKGGNINVWGGSYIHTTSTGGTFFKLYGNSHAYGVQRFLCIGARMEHRFTTSQLIDCQWNDGVVSFINVDTGSQSQITGASTMTVAKFTSSNQKMPVIKFDNCSLMGQHQFVYNTNSYAFPHNVVYENCEFTNVTKRSDFITFSALGSNPAGRPAINFRNCRGIGNTQKELWEGTLGFEKASVAVVTKKVISLKGADSKFPTNGGTVDVYLPLNVLVTKVILHSPAGAVTETDAATFSVQTYEATPTTLATITAANHSAGFNLNQDVLFACSDDNKRHLKLVAGSDVSQFNPSAYCLIEYIG